VVDRDSTTTAYVVVSDINGVLGFALRVGIRKPVPGRKLFGCSLCAYARTSHGLCPNDLLTAAGSGIHTAPQVSMSSGDGV
jgi:hypothetical protein